MKTRLQHIVKSEGLTNQKFAAEIGVSPAAVTHILSGRNNPSLEIISKIASRYPQYSLRWLILGELPILLPDSSSEGDITTKQPTLSPTLPFEESSNDILQITHATDTTQTARHTHNEEDASNNTISPYIGLSTGEPKNSVDKLIICFPDGTFKEYSRQ